MAQVGTVTHFYDKINVAIVKLTAPLKAGDPLVFKGHTTDFKQNADSMQLDHKDVTEAAKGDEVGIKVTEKVREGDTVSKEKE